MTTIADTYDYIVGVDTHARTHTYCVICAKTGAVMDTATFRRQRRESTGH
jgi:hypothetical protein